MLNRLVVLGTIGIVLKKVIFHVLIVIKNLRFMQNLSLFPYYISDFSFKTFIVSVGQEHKSSQKNSQPI